MYANNVHECPTTAHWIHLLAGRLAGRHSPQTKMTVCPDAAYSKTYGQKVPGRALVVFLSAYTKQGSGGCSVGTWALKGFGEAALTGTAGLRGGGSSPQWCPVSTLMANLYFCVVAHPPFCIATKRKGLWVSTAHRDEQGRCANWAAGHFHARTDQRRHEQMLRSKSYNLLFARFCWVNMDMWCSIANLKIIKTDHIRYLTLPECK